MSHSPLELAEAFIRSGELAEALTTLTQHLQAAPTDEAARRLRAAVLLRVPGDTNLRAALDDLAHLTTPADAVQRSVILERLGDLAGALTALPTTGTAPSDDERLAERRLHLLVGQGEIARARVFAEQLPPTWRWQQWAGDLAAQMGDDVAAIDDYTQALTHFSETGSLLENKYALPIAARLLLSRAHARRRLGQAGAAEADYQAAEKLIPTDPVIPFNRGLTRAMQGDLTSATALCRAALAQALPALRTEMERELNKDGRYAALAVLVLR